MKKTGSTTIWAILTVFFLSSWYLHPTPAAAVVEVPQGVVATADQKMMKEILAAFDRAEVAVQQADLEALMDFYAKGYNYHGLKRPDVRRVWSEVFTHYELLTSKHVFTELKLVKDGTVRKAYVTCTGGLYGMEKETGKPITIDSWVQEVHHLVKEKGGWKFLGNAGGTSLSAPPASAPHHPLF
jgi:ketosteroid isomerase-like protein